jgi:hypothetical protein
MTLQQSALALAFALLSVTPVAADELSDFTSDGCSAFPDGTYEEKELWHSCCVEHDLAYWVGGSSDDREVADHELESCVEAVGKPTIAKLMLAGVRVGGTPWLPTRFRWAYGWPYLRGYTQVSEEEAKQVEQKMGAALKRVEKQRPTPPTSDN